MEKHIEKICKKFFETDLEWCDLISDTVLRSNSKAHVKMLTFAVFHCLLTRKNPPFSLSNYICIHSNNNFLENLVNNHIFPVFRSAHNQLDQLS